MGYTLEPPFVEGGRLVGFGISPDPLENGGAEPADSCLGNDIGGAGWMERSVPSCPGGEQVATAGWAS